MFKCDLEPHQWESNYLRLDLIDLYNNIRLTRFNKMIDCLNITVNDTSIDYIFRCNLSVHLTMLKDGLAQIAAMNLSILDTHELLLKIHVTIQKKLTILAKGKYKAVSNFITNTLLNDRFDHLQSDMAEVMLRKHEKIIDIVTFARMKQCGNHIDSVLIDEITFVKANRICFRGDSRNPAIIFKSGFQPANRNIAYAFTPYNASNAVVSLTPKFSAAACFPLVLDRKETWIYVINASKVFNLDSASFIFNNHISWNYYPEACRAMFASELISENIDPRHVYAAVKIERSFLAWSALADGENVKDYTFKITSYQFNLDSDMSAQEKKIISDFLDSEMTPKNKLIKLPTLKSGYEINRLFKHSKAQLDITSLNIQNDSSNAQLNVLLRLLQSNKHSYINLLPANVIKELLIPMVAKNSIFMRNKSYSNIKMPYLVFFKHPYVISAMEICGIKYPIQLLIGNTPYILNELTTLSAVGIIKNNPRLIVDVARMSIQSIMLFMSAALDDKERLIKLASRLINKSGNVDQSNHCDITPIAAAIYNNNITALKNLLSVGLNIHQPNENGLTPVQLAIAYKNLEACELLIAAGAIMSTELSSQLVTYGSRCYI